MKWVLLLTILSPASGSQSAVQIDFSSQNLCEQALEQFLTVGGNQTANIKNGAIYKFEDQTDACKKDIDACMATATEIGGPTIAQLKTPFSQIRWGMCMQTE